MYMCVCNRTDKHKYDNIDTSKFSKKNVCAKKNLEIKKGP